MNQWVQHISGQGEKWEVLLDEPNFPHLWAVRDHGSRHYQLFRNHPAYVEAGGPLGWLPKSEYKLCEPSEQWVDVTADCRVEGWAKEFRETPALVIYHGSDWLVNSENGYRLRKVMGRVHGGPLAVPEWSFIVEKREL